MGTTINSNIFKGFTRSVSHKKSPTLTSTINSAPLHVKPLVEKINTEFEMNLKSLKNDYQYVIGSDGVCSDVISHLTYKALIDVRLKCKENLPYFSKLKKDSNGNLLFKYSLPKVNTEAYKNSTLLNDKPLTAGKWVKLKENDTLKIMGEEKPVNDLVSYLGRAKTPNTFPFGSIGLSQGNIGDCYFVATIDSISKNPKGASLLSDMIKKTPKGDYSITFPNKNPIKVKRRSLLFTEVNNNKIPVLGDIRALALERAFGRLEKNRLKSKLLNRNSLSAISHGGKAYKVYQKLMGWKEVSINSRINLFSLKTMGLQNKATRLLDAFADNPKDYILTTGSCYFFKSKKPELLTKHAYSIERVDKNTKTVTLTDPHDTFTRKTILSFKEFFSCFRDIAGVKVPKELRISVSRF